LLYPRTTTYELLKLFVDEIFLKSQQNDNRLPWPKVFCYCIFLYILKQFVYVITYNKHVIGLGYYVGTYSHIDIISRQFTANYLTYRSKQYNIVHTIGEIY